MVMMAIRRRRGETLTVHDGRDVGENIVCYDDEGGGEEDTEAFDMSALRPKSRTHQKQLFQEFIRDRQKEADQDSTAPPYDSLQTFVFEGAGSVAPSLSSLSSSGSEQEFGFLREWGPRFRRLADLYRPEEAPVVTS